MRLVVVIVLVTIMLLHAITIAAILWRLLRLMDKILHDLKDSKLWELWYIPYNG